MAESTATDDLLEYLSRLQREGKLNFAPPPDPKAPAIAAERERIAQAIPAATHPLDRVRAALELYELERYRRGRWEVPLDEAREARGRIGKILGMSGRQVQRYLAILKGETAIQAAVRDGVLPLELAVRLARLPADVQQKAARLLAEGKSPRAVAARLLAGSRRTAAGPRGMLEQVLRRLESGRFKLPAADGPKWLALLEELTSRVRERIATLASRPARAVGKAASERE